MSILRAYNKDGDTFHISEYSDDLKGKLFCAEGHKVVARRGRKTIHHYAHGKGCGDLACSKGTGEWHLESQNRVKTEYLEIRVKGKNKYHIADVLTPEKYVIEYQKSIVGPDVIEAREKFYNEHCNKLVWVIDASKMDIEITPIGDNLYKVDVLKGSLFWKICKSVTFLDQGKRGYLEITDMKTMRCRICGFNEFDKRYLSTCLKVDADKRKNRHHY